MFLTTHQQKIYLLAIFSLISLISSAQVNLDSGLVGYFTLDGNALDKSPIAIDGTVNNATLTIGKTNNIDSAYYFNGITANISCSSDNRGIKDAVTISVWVKTIMNNIGWVVGKYDWQVDKGFSIQIKDGHPFVSGRNGGNQYLSTYSPNSTIIVNDGNWHHLVVVIDGNSWSMSIDCQLDTTIFGIALNPALDNPEPLAIGYYPFGGGTFDHNYFEGSIDEVRIYNRVLIPAELKLICDINYVDTISSAFIPPPTVPQDDSVCIGTNITFQAKSDTGTVYWLDSLGTILDTGLTYTTVVDKDMTYFLYTDVNGNQSDMISLHIKALDCKGAIFPNVFTPNGDGVNDYLRFIIPYATCFDLVIYNRWGVEVYKSNQVEFGWDGRLVSSGTTVPDGVYFYTLTYCVNGEAAQIKNGSITVFSK